jgi:hypothetical protein
LEVAGGQGVRNVEKSFQNYLSGFLEENESFGVGRQVKRPYKAEGDRAMDFRAAWPKLKSFNIDGQDAQDQGGASRGEAQDGGKSG